MGQELKMYSNKEFGKRLKYLRDEAGVEQKELSEHIKNTYATTFSVKQMQKYESENCTDIIKADNLYAIAESFQASVDYLLGRVDEVDGVYISENDNSEYNKLNLDANTRNKLRSLSNEHSIKVLNQLICKTNVLDVFIQQLEEVSNQYKNIGTDGNVSEQKEEILDVASYRVQREIDKLFRKYIKTFLK